MNNVYQLPDKDCVYDEASLWLAKVEKGLTEEDEKGLQVWLQTDQENRKIFIEMATLWDRMDALSRLSDLFPQPDTQLTKRRWAIPVMAFGIAMIVLSLLLFSVMKPLLFLDNKSAVVQAPNNVKTRYKTEIGERKKQVLADGTLLELNTNSLVQIRYTAQYRFVDLERGELNIDVAHDTSRPLIVRVGNQLIQAVGTAFNVEFRGDDNIELVVTEGKVLVGERPISEATVSNAPFVKLKPNALTVSEGEQVILGAPKKLLEKIEPAEIETKLSWLDGNLIFSGESLEDAITEISRYTHDKFVILDENLKNIRVAGMFKAGDVDGLLKSLQQNFKIVYHRQEDKILLGRD